MWDGVRRRTEEEIESEKERCADEPMQGKLEEPRERKEERDRKRKSALRETKIRRSERIKVLEKRKRELLG